MKASELINKLLVMKKEHGDLTVTVEVKIWDELENAEVNELQVCEEGFHKAEGDGFSKEKSILLLGDQ